VVHECDTLGCHKSSTGQGEWNRGRLSSSHHLQEWGWALPLPFSLPLPFIPSLEDSLRTTVNTLASSSSLHHLWFMKSRESQQRGGLHGSLFQASSCPVLQDSQTQAALCFLLVVAAGSWQHYPSPAHPGLGLRLVTRAGPATSKQSASKGAAVHILRDTV
jgi:hypothetical protein